MVDKSSAAISEERTAAASYILTFYQEVLYLTHNYSQYLNKLSEIQHKYSSTDLGKLGDVEKEELKGVSQHVRYYIHKCYIQYACIAGSVTKFKKDGDMDKIYLEIKDKLIVDRVKLEKFVIAMNKALIHNVMKNLLETSQDIVESIYKKE